MSVPLKTNRTRFRHTKRTLLVLITIALVFAVLLMCSVKTSGLWRAAVGVAGILCVGWIGYVAVAAAKHRWSLTTTTARNDRCYHLTADCLVLGFFVVEGFLLFSDYFCWFPFKQYRDLSLLIAVTAVGATLVLLLLWLEMTRAFRWRFQFSLCSLFFLVLAIAVMGSWLAVEMRRQSSEQEAAGAIVTDGGEHGRLPTFLGRLIRDESLEEVTSLYLRGTPVTDADLIHLRHFPFLSDLDLKGTHITDAGLVHLRELSYLISLDLRETNVTDAGLENLRGLKRLQLLYLSDTRISDAGLVHLRELPQLVIVCLDGTAVTEQGADEFEQTSPGFEIWR